MEQLMKIATWNVNSVRTREARLLDWLEREQPDALCLQELKAPTAEFPYEQVEALGYHCAVHGQKTYNGVAVLSKEKPAEVRTGMGDEEQAGDDQARLICSTLPSILGPVHVYSAYVPNGKAVDDDKYIYKLAWMDRLAALLESRHAKDEHVVLTGDFNVALDDLDAKNPEKWVASVLCTQDVRDRVAAWASWGLSDVFRPHHPEGGVYSWWDYRRLAFPKNDGLRIDHIFASEAFAQACTRARIDRDQRKGEKPSDHAPVIAEFGA